MSDFDNLVGSTREWDSAGVIIKILEDGTFKVVKNRYGDSVLVFKETTVSYKVTERVPEAGA